MMKNRAKLKAYFNKNWRKENTSNTNESRGAVREEKIVRGDYVALREDIISRNRKNPDDLFMGQVGRVGIDVKAEESPRTFAVYFEDELAGHTDPDPKPLSSRYLEVDDVIKLHCTTEENPQINNEYYNTLVTEAVEGGAALLEQWQEDLDLVTNTKELTIEHTGMDTRFDPGNIVTILYDFALKENDQTKLIYAGQVGIIKNCLEQNYVHVVFVSRMFPDFTFIEENLEAIKDIKALEDEDDLIAEAEIHKSFLLPLYYTKLTPTPKGEEQIYSLVKLREAKNGISSFFPFRKAR